MRKSFLLIIVVLCIVSCSDSAVFDTYKPLAKGQWQKDSILNFSFTPIDTISKNNIFINLRNNDEYQYSNLFLIVGIDFPNNYSVVDTLEYEMTDVNGKFLGTGLTDLKENKLEYKTNVVFPTTGTYDISLQHAMRKSGAVEGIEYLKGVTDIGIRIEKNTVNE